MRKGATIKSRVPRTPALHVGLGLSASNYKLQK